MTRYSLKVPQFQIFIGSEDISEAVVGYSFHHPLAEPSTPLIWTGTIEMFPARSGHPRSFFDDEANPSRWLSGLQPIDVYFNGIWWQRFRIKPSGYRYNQDNGQAEIEITDIIGILDSYAPSADTPEFKTGGNNYWNDLAVALIKKQAAIMGTTVTVETPPYGIGGIYRVPRSVQGSYIKEAQKMAGERGYWMWSDKETIKWAEYPTSANNIVWRKSRRELLTFTRQQGLDPVKQQVTVSATHEDVDICNEIYPKTIYTFVSYGSVTSSTSNVGQLYSRLALVETRNKQVLNNCIYKLTKKRRGNPMLSLFGATIEANGSVRGNPPEVKGWTRTQLQGVDQYFFTFKYTKRITDIQEIVRFVDWLETRDLLDETDITTYENIPLDSQNPSKILSRVITRSEPWAKYPDGLQYYSPIEWWVVDASDSRRITERITTTYTYTEITREDIVVKTGQRLYEIKSISEVKEGLYFEKRREGGFNPYTYVIPRLVLTEKTITTYTKQCQGRWTERKEVYQQKGQSTTSQGFLYNSNITEEDVTSIPEITYRPPPYPVIQRPLLATVETGYAGVSPFVQSKDFESASTLTTKAECDRYARYLGQIKWQRYYGRELASGFSTTLSYTPFQGVDAGNGRYIRDRFGVSLNRDSDAWQFVEDCIGNKTGAISEIAPPTLPYPPVLISTLNIGNTPTQNFVQGIAIIPITFNASGGQSPYTYSSTTLPAGLSLSSGGVLTGTPTAIGTTSVTVTVTDALLATDSTTFNIVIAVAPIPAAITSETIKINIDIGLSTSVGFLGGLPALVAAVSTLIDSTKVAFTPVLP